MATDELQEENKFPEDPGVTDIAFVVEGKRVHTIKAILACASPVFKSMFNLDFKEKYASEIDLPGKKHDAFVKFLKCIIPIDYLELDGNTIGEILPLAKEYRVNAIIKECEAWLLKEIERREFVKNMEISREGKSEFLLRCYYYSCEYNLTKLHDRTFKKLFKFQFNSYKDSEFYALLSDKNKIELLEKRVSNLDDTISRKRDTSHLMYS
ncbi:uncharacterized protein LOC134240942 [Saccostrea cucullata]|uniref:uncharacterized protein LOC134240942 n=1 Tax=Saccostrea cuccullata TaxID=36930 RepID=UPI002ED2EFC7